jgi:hypothetical protein
MKMLDPILRAKALELLPDNHENDIGFLLGLGRDFDAMLEGRQYCRDIYLNEFGYSVHDFSPKDLAIMWDGNDGWGIFADNGLEWIDETGNNLVFDTQAEAAEYLDEVIAKELQKEIEMNSK